MGCQTPEPISAYPRKFKTSVPTWIGTSFTKFPRYAWIPRTNIDDLTFGSKVPDTVTRPSGGVHVTFATSPVVAEIEDAVRVVYQDNGARLLHWVSKTTLAPVVIHRLEQSNIKVIPGAFVSKQGEHWYPFGVGFNLRQLVIPNDSVGGVFSGPPRTIRYRNPADTKYGSLDTLQGNLVGSFGLAFDFEVVGPHSSELSRIKVDHGYIQGTLLASKTESRSGGWSYAGGAAAPGSAALPFQIPQGACLYHKGLLVGVALRNFNSSGQNRLTLMKHTFEIHRNNGEILMCMSESQAEKERNHRWQSFELVEAKSSDIL